MMKLFDRHKRILVGQYVNGIKTGVLSGEYGVSPTWLL